MIVRFIVGIDGSVKSDVYALAQGERLSVPTAHFDGTPCFTHNILT
jgi:hypothetical protein